MRRIPAGISELLLTGFVNSNFLPTLSAKMVCRLAIRKQAGNYHSKNWHQKQCPTCK